MNDKPKTNYLLSKWFWILFTITVIVVLYLYGMKMIGDKTEIAQTKKTLVSVNEELVKCNQENSTKTTKIKDLQNEIKQLNDKLIQNTNLISILSDSISKLMNRPPKVEYKYNTIYKERPEPFHQYGKGYGKLTLFKSCNCYNMKFWIDGEYVGDTKLVYSSGYPSCGESGTVSKIVLAGKHHIQGQDQENHSWDFYVTVIEDECLIYGVK